MLLLKCVELQGLWYKPCNLPVYVKGSLRDSEACHWAPEMGKRYITLWRSSSLAHRCLTPVTRIILPGCLTILLLSHHFDNIRTADYMHFEESVSVFVKCHFSFVDRCLSSLDLHPSFIQLQDFGITFLNTSSRKHLWLNGVEKSFEEPQIPAVIFLSIAQAT